MEKSGRLAGRSDRLAQQPSIWPDTFHFAFCILNFAFPSYLCLIIPASPRVNPGLPMDLNILRIWAYWRSRWLTCWTVVPEPRAMRLRRLPLIT